jgi:hypothetical protein
VSGYGRDSQKGYASEQAELLKYSPLLLARYNKGNHAEDAIKER